MRTSSQSPNLPFAQLPSSAASAVLRVLGFHIGRSKAISRFALLAAVLAQLPERSDRQRSTPSAAKERRYKLNDRSLRLLVRQLRRQGHLIGSAPGEDGGYYLISDPIEFQEFMQQEYMALITDMSETAAAMRRSAEQKFGAGSTSQPALF